MLIKPEHAADALMAMARWRGLHASRSESEQAWEQIASAETVAQRLSLAWSRLFEGQKAETVPLALLNKSQLPAWVVCGDAIGLLRTLPEHIAAEDVDWFTPAAEGALTEVEVLVPLLVLTDKVTIKPEEDDEPATRVIKAALKLHSPLFKRAAIATVVSNLFAVLTGLFAMQVYDRVVPNYAYATLSFLAGGMAVALLLDYFFKVIKMRVLESSKHQLDEVLSLYIFEKLLNLKIDRRPQRLGSLAAQVRDYETIRNFFSSSTIFAMADIPFSIVFIAVMYSIGGLVALVPTVFMIISIFIGVMSTRTAAKAQANFKDVTIYKQGLLYEAIASGEVIKATGGEAKFSDAWIASTRDAADRGEDLIFASSKAQFLTEFFQKLCFVAVLAVGVYVIETGGMTMGGLIACYILSGRTLSFISRISAIILQYQGAKHSLNILNELMSCDADDDRSRLSNTHTQPLDLEFEGVAYGYPGATLPQLVIPKLKINAGERIAILGKNGSGKSTFLKVLSGIYTPGSGQVRIAGLDIEQCRPSWLREEIGFLSQDPRLFSGTLLDNLTLGLSMPPEEEIWAALTKTGLDQAVAAHPEGLLLPIHEGGSGMSGGQRQLVGLTRMVLQNPHIWVLDEPSANLDNLVEEKVVELVTSLPADRTVIFTTHRMTWMKLSQRVLIIENGQIKLDAPSDKVQTLTTGDVRREAG